MGFEDDPRIREHFVRQPSSSQTGVATIAEHLLDKVTQYHAQIGAESKVSLSHLRELEHKLVEEARELCIAQRWDEALNTFTHALAVTEKAHAADDSKEMKAALVHNIGYCLHCLGEFEAAQAYYEQALTRFRGLTTPFLDRWTIGWIFGDLNDNRVQFIKERLLDISFGRLPEAKYLDGMGRKRPMPDKPSAKLPPRPGGSGPSRWETAAPERVAVEAEERRPGWLAATHAAISDGAGPSEHGVEQEESDPRDEAELEAARKEWFEYYCKVGEWHEAEGLAVTKEEKEDLDYLRGREQRAGRQ